MNFNFNKLREWQKEIISQKEWKNKKNYIINVPPLCGKTLMAKLSIDQEEKNFLGGIFIYCVPTIALLNEKFNFFKELYQNKLKIYKNFKKNVNGIFICCHENINSIINELYEEKKIHFLKLLIIDEIQMIGDTINGSMIENFLIKVKIIDESIRIIGLTSSISKESSIALSKWLKAKLYYENSIKLNIDQFLVINNEKEEFIENIDLYESDTLSSFLNSNIKEDILYFVENNEDCLKTAQKIYNILFKNNENSKKKDRIQLCKKLSIIDSKFINHYQIYFENGIGIYNSDFNIESKPLIENAIRENIFQIIISTLELSIGINFLNPSIIIIQNFQNSFNYINYYQMIGRGNRININKIKIYFFIETFQIKKNILNIINLEFKNLKSSFFKKVKFSRNEVNFDHFYLSFLNYFPNIEEKLFFEVSFYNSLTKMNKKMIEEKYYHCKRKLFEYSCLSPGIDSKKEIIENENLLKSKFDLTLTGQLISQNELFIEEGDNLINLINKFVDNSDRTFFEFLSLLIPNYTSFFINDDFLLRITLPFFNLETEMKIYEKYKEIRKEDNYIFTRIIKIAKLFSKIENDIPQNYKRKFFINQGNYESILNQVFLYAKKVYNIIFKLNQNIIPEQIDCFFIKFYFFLDKEESIKYISHIKDKFKTLKKIISKETITKEEKKNIKKNFNLLFSLK